MCWVYILLWVEGVGWVYILLWVEGVLGDDGPGWDGEEGEEPAHEEVEGVVPVGVGQEHVHHQDVVHMQTLHHSKHWIEGWLIGWTDFFRKKGHSA